MISFRTENSSLSTQSSIRLHGEEYDSTPEQHSSRKVDTLYHNSTTDRLMIKEYERDAVRD